MRFRRIAMAAAVGLAAVFIDGAALAQDDVCTRLEAELASLEQGPAAGAVVNYRQFEAAVMRQRAELDRASAQAQRAGCLGGLFVFQPKPSAKCAPLVATIERMKANLKRLTAARDSYSTDPYERSRRRSAVLGALAANRCGANYAGAPPPARSGNFLDMLFGNARLRGFEDRTYAPGGQFGTYRTLCVRTCDGYYFPISFSTVPSRFSADQDTCQSMCPASEVALYVYRNPGEDVSQMVSLAGEPYSALPAAFRYRQEYDAACTCGAPSVAALTPLTAPAALSPAPSAPVSTLPKPTARPVVGEDPETLANRAGAFAPKRVAGQNGDDAVAGAAGDGQRSIRMVGPKYYYGQ